MSDKATIEIECEPGNESISVLNNLPTIRCDKQIETSKADLIAFIMAHSARPLLAMNKKQLMGMQLDIIKGVGKK